MTDVDEKLDRPVRVLEVIKSLERGGAEALLAGRVSSPGAQVEYAVACVVGGDDSWAPILLRRGVPVSVLASAAGLDSVLIGCVRLLNLVRRSRPDVVHVHSPLLAVVLRLANMVIPRRFRVRLVVTEHSVSYHSLTSLAWRLTAGAEDHVIAVSSAVAESLPKRARRHSSLILHGVDRERIVRRSEEAPTEWRDRLGMDNGPLVVTIANCRPAKRLDVLNEAAAIATGELPDLHFAIAGDGALLPALRKQAEDCGLADRVHFLGRVPDAWTLLVEADLFVLTSDWEGLPVAAMEALAAGVPIIATDVGGMSEIVTPDVGRLVARRSPDLIAAEIVSMLADTEQLARMSAQALERSLRFDATHSNRRIENVLLGRP